jgi:hypothetical protein
MHNLSLQNSVLNNALAMLGPDTRKPNHLLILLAINQNIRRELVPADMRYKEYTHPASPGVIRIPVQAQGTKMSLQLALNQRCCNTTARVSASVRAQQYHVVKFAGPSAHPARGRGLVSILLVGGVVNESGYQVWNVCLCDGIDVCE